MTTDFLAVIFARISAIKARNGVNRARKRGAITRNTVEILRVIARSRAHFHTGLAYCLSEYATAFLETQYREQYIPITLFLGVGGVGGDCGVRDSGVSALIASSNSLFISYLDPVYQF